MRIETNTHALTRAAYDEQRRVLRVPVPASLRGVAVDRSAATLNDISPLGCQVSLMAYVAVGSYVVLTIPSFAPLGATVMWSEADTVGLQFAEPLHPAIVDHIASVYRH